MRWNQWFDVVLGYRDGARQLFPVQLSEPEVSVSEAVGVPTPDFVLPNGSGVAYGLMTLDAESLAALQAETTRQRGAPYRVIDDLVISPSSDIGVLAMQLLKRERWRLSREGPLGLLLSVIFSGRKPNDLLSYLLFDGAYARRLIEVGRQDALAAAREIRVFFAR